MDKTSVIVVLALGLILVGCSPAEDAAAKNAHRQPRVAKRGGMIPDVSRARTRRPNAAEPERVKPTLAADEELERLPQRDAEVCRALRNALDEDDLNGVMAAVGGINTNSDVMVRREAVEALGWFGDNLVALEKLQTFIDDPDEEVAAEAFRRMDENTDLIEDETERNNYLLRAFYRHSERMEVIDYVCDKLKNADSNEATMQTLVKLAVSGNPLAMARAKEAYKFITGETYISSEQAIKWAKENGE